MMRYLMIMLMMAAVLALAGCSRAAEVRPASGPESGPAQPATFQDAPPEPAEGGATASGESPASGGKPAAASATSSGTSSGTTSGASGGPGAGAAAEPMTRSGPESGTVMRDVPTSMPQELDGASAEGMRMDRSGGEPPTMPGRPGGPPDHDWRPPRHQPELKAGEVDDNDRWREYLKFVDEYSGPAVHETDLGNRQIITVVDRNGNPVPNADVVISAHQDGKGPLWTNVTYADGRTMFFPAEAADPRMMMRDGPEPPGEFQVTVRRDGFTEETTIGTIEPGNTEIRLEGTMDYGDRVPLDVLFLLDSTGSMADEINQIKTTLQSIAEQVSQLQSKPDLRFAMVSYRDRGDDYVTRLYDFDGDVERFQRSIRRVEADGGDDYPESLNQALHEAVNDAGWGRDSIRLVFLIADAPPHLDYAQDEDYAREMVRAREKGIKVFSVASSGLDEQGEYVFRQIAQQTMGKFLFILYRTGPQGSLETLHDVEQYSVDRLDSLIVRLIDDELAPLGKAGNQADEPGMGMK